MNINFIVYETSKVEPIGEQVAVLQGENNNKIFNFTLPATIRGYAIANYTQEIKFESEKGEVLRFYMTNGQFALKSEITRFKSALVQLVLINSIDEDKPIVWRTIPFKYDFVQSINAVNEIGD